MKQGISLYSVLSFNIPFAGLYEENPKHLQDLQHYKLVLCDLGKDCEIATELIFCNLKGKS